MLSYDDEEEEEEAPRARTWFDYSSFHWFSLQYVMGGIRYLGRKVSPSY